MMYVGRCIDVKNVTRNIYKRDKWHRLNGCVFGAEHNAYFFRIVNVNIIVNLHISRADPSLFSHH